MVNLDLLFVDKLPGSIECTELGFNSKTIDLLICAGVLGRPDAVNTLGELFGRWLSN